MARRRRLDAELVRRGLVTSADAATHVIATGRVTVDGAPALKPTSQILPTSDLVVREPPPQYVSRGGDKLAHALSTFTIDVARRRCLDAGMSTGGFTDCLLQHGAQHVTGVDVGYGQVAERIRTHNRVDVRERTNIRDVTVETLDGPVDLVVCDVSFIALRTVLPVLVELATADADLVALVKPQFEAERDEVAAGGVVRDPGVWARTVTAVCHSSAELGWGVVDVTASPLPGPAGNVEFLVHARCGPPHAKLRLGDVFDEARHLADEAGVTLVES